MRAKLARRQWTCRLMIPRTIPAFFASVPHHFYSFYFFPPNEISKWFLHRRCARRTLYRGPIGRAATFHWLSTSNSELWSFSSCDTKTRSPPVLFRVKWELYIDDRPIRASLSIDWTAREDRQKEAKREFVQAGRVLTKRCGVIRVVLLASCSSYAIPPCLLYAYHFRSARGCMFDTGLPR